MQPPLLRVSISAAILLFVPGFLIGTIETCSCDPWDDSILNITNTEELSYQPWLSRVLIVGKWTNISYPTPSSYDPCLTCPRQKMCYAVEHIQVFLHPKNDGQRFMVARRGRIETSSYDGNCGLPQLPVGREYLLRGEAPKQSVNGTKKSKWNATADAVELATLQMSLCEQYWGEKGMEWRSLPESLKERLNEML